MSPAALVTGASSGIGRAFATALAVRGHDLVVVARDGPRLDALQAELAPVPVEVLVADLTVTEGLARVERRLADADRPIDVLVNNAGFGTTGRFAELPVEEEDREIRLNVLALTRLTRAALPGLLARRRGGVINVGSIASFQPTPGTATYGATKAYVLSFTQALREELRGTGVTALAVCPGMTVTEFQARAGYEVKGAGRLYSQTAEQVVASSLRAFKRDAGIHVPGVPNKIVAGSTHLVPRRLLARLARLVSAQV